MYSCERKVFDKPPAMAGIKPWELPEVVERRTFPFFTSPRADAQFSARSNVSAPGKTVPYRLTAAGLTLVNEKGPLWQHKQDCKKIPRNYRHKFSKHKYEAGYSFGHWNAANDMNQFLAYDRVPNYSLSSEEFGNCYKHPSQTYMTTFKNRVPNLFASRQNMDVWRANTGLMY